MGSLGAEVLVRDKDVSSFSTTWSWDKTLIFGIWFPNSKTILSYFRPSFNTFCYKYVFFGGKEPTHPLISNFHPCELRKCSLTRSSLVKIKKLLLTKFPFPFSFVKGDDFCHFVGLGKVCFDIDKLFCSENSGAVLSNINLNNVQLSSFVNIFIFQLVSLYIHA